MSIKDHEDNEIIQLPGFWSSLAKFALLTSGPLFMAAITLIAWIVVQIFHHDTRIAVLEQRVHSVGSAAQTTTVSVNDGAVKPGSQRDYLTTLEVSERENVSVRTIQDWIARNRIAPPPVKHGKEYAIAAEYRILPQDAAPP